MQRPDRSAEGTLAALSDHLLARSVRAQRADGVTGLVSQATDASPYHLFAQANAPIHHCFTLWKS
jgi:hypothetical protein